MPILNIFKPLVLLGLLLLSVATQAQTPSLVGHWYSEQVENYGNVFATREFRFTQQEWFVIYRTFADKSGKQPLFTINVTGVYVLGDKSAKVAGAYEGIFPALHRSITAESAAGKALFAQQGCELKLGLALSLVNTGCGFVPGIMQAMGEYDLVAVQANKIYFGERAGDLTKARPDKLTTYPVVRQ